MTNVNVEIQARHEQSVHDYPFLNFMPKEYMIIDVKRSVWGYVRIWGVVFAMAATLISASIILGSMSGESVTGFIIGCALALCVFIGGTIAASVFKKNKFIVTNERVYMYIQITPFAHRVQNIELKKVEDFSYTQNGIFETMLNYGAIRLSTVGDESSYPFDFVDHPAEQFKTINAIVKTVRSKQYRPKNGD